VSRFRARIPDAKKFSGKKVEKYDYEKMMKSEKQYAYKQKLTEPLQELAVNSDGGLDSRWKQITCTVRKIAEEVFGKTGRQQLNVWFDEECQEATEEKKKSYVNTQQRWIQGLQLTSAGKHEEKKNKYIRGRRKNMKIVRLKNWRN
jgi:hypothetical protein